MFLIDFILHIDRHLQQLASEYGLWIYGILFLIVFCETGLVVLPLLPGDSLLFAAGSLASLEGSQLNPHVLFAGLSLAGILGDSVNYWIGKTVGAKVFASQNSRFFKREYLEKTQAFYLKHGTKTIIIARFIPIIRTFAPFVAGIGTMPYRTFIVYNIVGAVLWVATFVYAGFYFGQLPMVQQNFKLIILAIIILSITPPVIEYLKHRYKKQ
ncbi:DedA family protein [Nitrosomonas oligotropha]|jgi:membrane-associated protein|uniref:DedA family protein n=1 Tax=Nitrosomonas oligotropha TaxID=42354 RepID=UPI000D4BAE5D|nr:DedA family protein [Nitrosomonas oligotropha]MXS81538.1 DedA family protein [Nitrosomonas oligotropha]